MPHTQKRKRNEKSSLSDDDSDDTINFKEQLIKKTKYNNKKSFNTSLEALKVDMINSANGGNNYHILKLQLSDRMIMKIGELGLGIIIFPWKQLTIIYWASQDVKIPSWLCLIRNAAMEVNKKGYENILFVKNEINVELPEY